MLRPGIMAWHPRVGKNTGKTKWWDTNVPQEAGMFTWRPNTAENGRIQAHSTEGPRALQTPDQRSSQNPAEMKREWTPPLILTKS